MCTTWLCIYQQQVLVLAQQLTQVQVKFHPERPDTRQVDRRYQFQPRQHQAGAMIYNFTAAGKNAVAIFDFGSDKTSSSSAFTIVFPTADASNAVLRIA
jgi:hypothetical protein